MTNTMPQSEDSGKFRDFAREVHEEVLMEELQELERFFSSELCGIKIDLNGLIEKARQEYQEQPLENLKEALRSVLRVIGEGWGRLQETEMSETHIKMHFQTILNSKTIRVSELPQSVQRFLDVVVSTRIKQRESKL